MAAPSSTPTRSPIQCGAHWTKPSGGGSSRPRTTWSTSLRWTLPNSPDVSIPVAADGLVYHLHKDGKLQCIDLETGKELYFERTHSVQHRASPILAGGNLYLCAKDGRCTVVKAGREFSIVSSNDLGEPITASPLVAGGALYLRTYDALYAIR